MKKILLMTTALLCLSGGALPALADDTTVDGITTLDRTGWTITASDEEKTGEDASLNHGYAVNIIDGNTDTFWHSSYNGTNAWGGTSGYHFFYIDLGEEKAFNAFKFTRRTGATQYNGTISAFEFYVSTEPITISVYTNDDNSQDRLSKTDVDANYTTWMTANSSAVTKVSESTSVAFDSSVYDYTYSFDSQTARYVLFRMKGNNNFANCAEFNLLNMTDAKILEEMNGVIDTQKSSIVEKIDYLEAQIPGFVSISAESTKTAINAITVTDVNDDVDALKQQINNLYYSLLDCANNAIVTIKNVRRSSSANHYLCATSTGTTNTSTQKDESCKWRLLHQSGTEYFKLCNMSNSKYINSSGFSTNADADESVQVRFIESTATDYPGVALQFINSTNGFNVNTNSGSLTTYGYGDGGSTWEVKLASVSPSEVVASTNESRTYYVIRNNRGYTNNTAQGSLLAIDAGAGTQSFDQDYARMGQPDDLGIYWYFTQDGDGYQLHNLLSDYTIDGSTVNYGLTIPATSNSTGDKAKYFTWMTANPTTFYLTPATSFNDYTGKHTTAVALNSNSAANQGETCIDLANYTGYDNGLGYRHAVGNEWHPSGGDSDNGSTFYIELADKSAVNETKAKYIAGVSIEDSFAALLAYPDAILSDEEVNESKNSCGIDWENITNPTTIAEANTNYKAGVASNVTTIEEAYNSCLAKMDGKEVTFKNDGRGAVYYLAIAESTSTTLSATQSNDLSTIWTIKIVSGEKFKLLNNKTNLYVGTKSPGGGQIPSTNEDDAAIYYLDLTYANPSLSTSANSAGSECLHLDGSIRIVKWYNASDSDASRWTVSAVDTDEAVTEALNSPVITNVADENGGNTVTIKLTVADGSTLAVTEGLGDHYVITLTPKTSGEATSVRRRTVSIDETTGVISVTKDEVTTDGATATISVGAVAAGDYDVEIPTGFFTVNDKLSAKISSSVNVPDQTTGIHTVNVDATDAAATEWFNVQGRRVANPTHGIYIRRQGSTVSKVTL